jgi:hypothetical protein
MIRARKKIAVTFLQYQNKAPNPNLASGTSLLGHA